MASKRVAVAIDHGKNFGLDPKDVGYETPSWMHP
jgi:hypothetical protein